MLRRPVEQAGEVVPLEPTPVHGVGQEVDEAGVRAAVAVVAAQGLEAAGGAAAVLLRAIHGRLPMPCGQVRGLPGWWRGWTPRRNGRRRSSLFPAIRRHPPRSASAEVWPRPLRRWRHGPLRSLSMPFLLLPLPP